MHARFGERRAMMALSNQVTIQSAKDAIQDLIAARDAARDQASLFSTEIWRSWRELEHQIDTKLEDVEHSMALGGAFLAETVTARASELRRAVDDLLREHSNRRAHSIMTAGVRTCRPEDTLDRVARILW